ncbi:MAG: amidohydrolase family protein [Planctomycetes bacterium]|nr:amidohydrolase family protein [Planctomycetota bacterium]
MQLFLADWLHRPGTFEKDGAVLVDDAGRIVAAGPRAEVRAHPRAAGAKETSLPGRALLPGTVSAHSHAFQVMLRGSSDHPPSFREWVKAHLYPLVERLDEASLEAAALLCFSQMARAGVTTVGEFHYIHNAHDDYAPRSRALAQVVIGAARRVGLRIAFVRAIYDVQERFGQGRFAESPQDAARAIRELHEEHAGDPHVTVLPAPHSLHGATREAVETGATLARELDTRWHIHLAEQRGDVGYSERFHGGTPLVVLDRWGVLDERTVLVHGIWLTAEERDLLARKKGALVSNPGTNMALGDGIAPLAELLALGVPVALGTDLNASPNVFAEMRTAEMLQRVHHLRMGVLSTAGGTAPDPERIFAMGTRHGAHVLDVDAGALEPGLWADLVAVDLADPSLLPASVLGGAALLSAITSSIAAESAVTDVFVAGRPVVRERAVVGLPQDELVDALRKAPALRPLQRA